MLTRDVRFAIRNPKSEIQALAAASAAHYVYRHPGAVQGLVLWAAYPATTDDLSSSGVAVASIYGLLDGLATPDKIAASRPLLPPDTRWVEIQDGNHAQFGWYGDQAGDLPAPSAARLNRRVLCRRPWRCWRRSPARLDGRQSVNLSAYGGDGC